MIRTTGNRGTAALRYAAVGLTLTLVLGGCSGREAGPGAEAAQGGTASSTPLESNTSSPTASETASASSSTPAAYKPATAQGPAENVPLPVMPELARQESSAGLQAFAKHWYALMNYGFETGDLTPLKEVSGANCVVCLNVYKLLELGYDEQDWVLGGKLEVLGTQTNYTITSKGLYQVLIQIKQDEYEYRGPGNHVYEVNEGLESTTVQMIEASYHDGQWLAENAVTIK